MDKLFIYILGAMIYWVPLANHSYYENQDHTNQRYQEIAKDVVEVVNESNITLPFDDIDARVRTALLLVSIAATESAFNRDIDNCKIVGDHGLAFGLWQTHTNRAGTCGNRKNAIRKAIAIVDQSFNACKKYQLLDRLSIYTSGSCYANWHPSRLKMSMALNYLFVHPFVE